MADWRPTTLGELTVNFDARRRPVKSSERSPGGYPYYGASGIVDRVDGYLYDGEYLLISEDGENLRARSTPIAFMASGRFWVNNHAHVVQANASADTRFLGYLLSVTDVMPYLSGSAQPKLSRASMDAIAVRVPPPAEQRAIAEVLGALDDKIAANTRLATTADDYLAELLERSLAEGDATTVSLGEIARINARSVKPGAGAIRYLDISSVRLGDYDPPAEVAWREAPSRARRAVAAGDTVWSTVRPNRRSHALVLSDDPLLVASTGLAVLTPTTVSFAYVYQVTQRPEFVAHLETVAEGSAYPAVRADRFGLAPVPMLSPNALRAFADIAEPLRRRVAADRDENLTLAATRDALLPALMSGKLRVRDVDRAVEQVV